MRKGERLLLLPVYLSFAPCVWFVLAVWWWPVQFGKINIRKHLELVGKIYWKRRRDTPYANSLSRNTNARREISVMVDTPRLLLTIREVAHKIRARTDSLARTPRNYYCCCGSLVVFLSDAQTRMDDGWKTGKIQAKVKLFFDRGEIFDKYRKQMGCYQQLGNHNKFLTRVLHTKSCAKNVENMCKNFFSFHIFNFYHTYFRWWTPPSRSFLQKILFFRYIIWSYWKKN